MLSWLTIGEKQEHGLAMLKALLISKAMDETENHYFTSLFYDFFIFRIYFDRVDMIRMHSSSLEFRWLKLIVSNKNTLFDMRVLITCVYILSSYLFTI